ncbi:hypothetical protein LINPERHAP2_LOCUS17006 [Linum perenne]
MRELVDERHVEKSNFKLSHLSTLECMMHTRLEGCQLLAEPHIKSKVRYMKDKFSASLHLKEASGFGWDEARGCVVADDEVFSGCVKVHFQKLDVVDGIQNVCVLLYHVWCIIIVCCKFSCKFELLTVSFVIVYYLLVRLRHVSSISLFHCLSKFYMF